MGQPIGLGNFVFRDFVKYILPTAIALTLFAPLLDRTFDLDTLVFASILLGYFLSPIATDLYEKTWFVKRAFAPKRAKLNAEKARWNLDRVFYSLDQDEKNAFYLTDAYRSFYLVASAYLFAYFLTLCGIFVYTSATRMLEQPDLSSAVEILTLLKDVAWDTETPVLLWDFPLIVVAIAVLLLCRQALKDSTHEMDVLFGRMYGEFARKFQIEGKAVALGVWGKVSNWKALEDRAGTIFIVDLQGGRMVGSTDVEKDGTFIFEGAFDACLNVDVAFELKGTALPFRVSEDAVPEFVIVLSKT